MPCLKKYWTPSILHIINTSHFNNPISHLKVWHNMNITCPCTWASILAAVSAASWSLSRWTWATATCVCWVCCSNCCLSNWIWWWVLSGSWAFEGYGESPNSWGELGDEMVPAVWKFNNQHLDYHDNKKCIRTWKCLDVRRLITWHFCWKL